MKIAHLKRSKSEAKERAKSVTEPGNDDYPYGTRMRFEKADMDKVGIAKPTPGDQYAIEGHAKVVSAHENHVELQVTHMGAKKHDAKSLRDTVKEAADKPAAKPFPRVGPGKFNKSPD